MAKITLNKTFRSWIELWESLSADLNSMFSEQYGKVLTADVVNNNATPNTLQDITELAFPVLAGKTYKFRFVIPFTSAATTTGCRFTVNGPTTPTMLNYTSRYPTGATAHTINYATAYQIPAACNTDTLTAGGVAVIEGFIKPSANGTLTPQFASEITASAVTAKAGAVGECQLVL